MWNWIPAPKWSFITFQALLALGIAGFITMMTGLSISDDGGGHTVAIVGAVLIFISILSAATIALCLPRSGGQR